ncbi:hypothetical protein QN277_009500 [Acacia crassicarpa]|uniref:Kinesin motor domain-containing protein n=1 Tax=Acacia crassicarpa TaxID=499986 RepID=A0AAE1IRB2_9FABA|nr:hypothetical protein QN277_009500 [Acacia crassicarpa]
MASKKKQSEGIALLSNVEMEDELTMSPEPEVVVRTRPAHSEGREGDETTKKVSLDTSCIADRKFTFDLVFDSNSYQ